MAKYDRFANGSGPSNPAANQLAERLVRIVARAFYTDEIVVVVDALVREKYLRDDTLGPVLNLKTKQVRKALTELETDDLVTSQLVSEPIPGTDDGNGQPLFLNRPYWYVDYSHFVDVLKLRLLLMRKNLEATERRETQERKLSCAACSAEWTEMELLRGERSASGKFRCRGCGSVDLLDLDNTSVLHDTQTQLKRLKAQLSKEESKEVVFRESISDMLAQLAGQKITRNLPTENRKHGAGGGARERAVARLAALKGKDGLKINALDGANGRVDSHDLLFGKDALGQTVSVQVAGGGGGADRLKAAEAEDAAGGSAQSEADAAAAAYAKQLREQIEAQWNEQFLAQQKAMAEAAGAPAAAPAAAAAAGEQATAQTEAPITESKKRPREEAVEDDEDDDDEEEDWEELE